MIEIRPARYDDIIDVEACLVRAREEMDFDIPEHEVPFALHNLLHQVEAGFLIVAEDAGYIVGVIALVPHHHPWNRTQKFLVNEHFFVDPDYRKGGTAKHLLDAAKVRADELNMPLRIDLIGGGDRQAKDRFMELNGFRFLGGQFLYERGR